MKRKLLKLNRHHSMRGQFALELYNHMISNKKIWVITGDLGYKVFDGIRKDFPERFVNVGAAEQTMMGIAVGLALEKKIPFVYSMTTFLLYRPFETIRNYIHYEKIPVRLVGSGRNRDYVHDGISHWAEEDRSVMKIFHNIESIWPEKIEQIPEIVKNMININKPWYINLRR